MAYYIAALMTVINSFDEGVGIKYMCTLSVAEAKILEAILKTSSHHRKSYQLAIQSYPNMITSHCLHSRLSKTVLGWKKIVLDIKQGWLTPSGFFPVKKQLSPMNLLERRGKDINILNPLDPKTNSKDRVC